MRIVAALAALFLLATPAPIALYAPHPVPGRAFVHFDWVPMVEADRGRRRLGALLYLGGWVLTSNDPRFGGLSALHVAEGRAMALSDRGFAMTFALPSSRAIVPLRINHLRDGPRIAGRGLSRDSESLAVAGDRAWVGYERTNAIWRYSLPGWRGDGGARPASIQGWRDNGGSEAMLRLADGRFLIFSEGTPAEGGATQVLLFDRDPAISAASPKRLAYRAPDGFRITDVAQLSDGRLLFLNRRLSLLWFTASLTVGELPVLGEGTSLSGTEIARFAPPVIADNMEALSVARENGCDTIWVASDDNFSPLQRTLLLKFALEPDRSR